MIICEITFLETSEQNIQLYFISNN